MQTRLSLESIEHEAYGAQHQDGLIDIFAGVGLLAIGLAWLTDQAWAGAIVPVLIIPLWKPLRARITEPRAGGVEFSDNRQLQEKGKYVWLIVAGLASLSLGLAFYFSVGERPVAWADYVAALPGVLLALGAVLVAVLFALHRFLIYAMTLLVGAVAATAQGLEPGVYMAEVGGFVTVVGLVILVRFLRANPIPNLDPQP